MTEQGFSDSSKVLRKVQLLLAKAEDSAVTEAEAKSYREKAEQLMVDYRIAEEEARETGAIGSQSKPVLREWIVASGFSPYGDDYWGMAVRSAYHAGVRIRYRYGSVNGKYMILADVVGYDIDVRYAEMLFTQAKLVFQENLEPQKVDGEEERITAFRFRNAGKTRREVAVMLWGSSVEHSVPAHQKVQKWYETEAAVRGITIVSGRGVSRKDFIKVYRESFLSRFSQRLREARSGVDKDSRAIVFAKREEAVDEAFYEAFPALRPSKLPAQQPQGEAKPKTKAEIAKEEAAQRRWDREWEKRESERARLFRSEAGRAGWTAGTEAANQVRIDGSSATKRVEG